MPLRWTSRSPLTRAQKVDLVVVATLACLDVVLTWLAAPIWLTMIVVLVQLIWLVKIFMWIRTFARSHP